jgi:hypothetical protein
VPGGWGYDAVHGHARFGAGACARAPERVTRFARAGLRGGVDLARAWQRERPGSLASSSGNWSRGTVRGQWRGD